MGSSVWKNTDTVTVWVWCLLKATHKGYKFPFNGKDIELAPGQFITGREAGAKESLTSTMSWRTCIAYLKSTNRITIKVTNKFTIISIVNWEGYQKLTNKKDTQLTNHQPTTNQQLTTYNTTKNGKNDKNTTTEVSHFLKSSKDFIPVDWKDRLNSPATYITIRRIKYRVVYGNDHQKYCVPPDKGKYIPYKELLTTFNK